MSKALEVAARAIAAHDGMEDEPGWWHIEYARSAIAAMEAEGFVMAPVEPTDAMILASMPHTGFAGDIMARQAAIDTWSAMIAARPRVD